MEMATYKVPQNVEADDKLIGPLSLKQFIFVILGLGSGYFTFFFFSKVHPVAGIPFVIPTAIFLILGLYQRADQPVEVYLASTIRFRLKPHKRIWDQEGYEERVIITAPPKIEKHYTKGYSQDQVTSRLGNLSRMMDTRGWASKLASDWQNPSFEATAASDRLVQPDEIAAPTTALSVYTQPVDIQDENTSMVARDLGSRIQQAENETHQNALRALEQARQATRQDSTDTVPSFTTYPSMHQKTVQPTSGTSAAAPAQAPAGNTVSPQPASPPAQAAPVATPAVSVPSEAPIAPPNTSNAPDADAATISSDGEVEIRLH